MSKEKQNDELVQMYRDLAEIFDEEYEKRRLITPKNTAEKMTAKGYRKQEWISVDERLPEESKSYLCFGYWTDDKTCGIYIVLYSCCEWMSYSDFVITHWMPLPEAPMMKGGAE